jgi:hypothetical protein
VTGNAYWASSGFDAVVPGNALPAGAVTLSVQAHSPSKGWWSKPVSITVSGPTEDSGLVLRVMYPAHNEEVRGNNDGQIRGLAFDTRTTASLGSGVDRIQAYLDGERGMAGSQYLGDATLTDSTWLVAWEPTRHNAVTHHVLFVYARSAVTGEERLVTREINILQD